MNKKQRRFVLFTVPEHGNAGDYLINYTEELFFKQFFSDEQVITITTMEWFYGKESFINFIRTEDILFINGGGYIGDLYPDTDNYKSIIEAFPDNIIFFFPNTFTYKSAELRKYKPFLDEMKWFGIQKKLYTMFRDEESFKTFSQYNREGEYFPDMALMNHVPIKDKLTKEKVLLCFRKDREKVFHDEVRLKRQLEEAELEYEEISIYAGHYVSQECGLFFIKELIRKIQSARVFITDRLHGMIMAVICDVPCIAFDNSTHKVKGVYNWIKDYVWFVEDNSVDGMQKMIESAIKKKKEAGTYKPLYEDFNRMADYINFKIPK